jgi:hypothetical protein
MSQPNLELETLVREYLDFEKKEEESEIFGLLLQYLSHLFEEDSEEPIFLEDVSAYEVDDFLNFFLEDNFPENFKDLQSKSKVVFQKFFKFLVKKKVLEKEDEKEWKEVLK